MRPWADSDIITIIFSIQFNRTSTCTTVTITHIHKIYLNVLQLLLHCVLSLAAQCIVIGPVCGGEAAGGRAVSEPYCSQRTRSVCVSLSAFCRQDAAKRQTASIKFTHRPKIGFFAQQGRLVAPIHVKLGMANRHVGTLSCANFCLSRRRGVGMRPHNIKNFHFLVKSRPAGVTPFTDF